MSDLAKPAYGMPCNNCGLCCRMEICPLGEIVFPNAVAPCPALESDGDRQVCGLIAHPSKYAPIRTSVHGVDAMRAAAINGTGAGVGCDSQLEEERNVIPPESFRVAMASIRRFKPAVVRQIRRLWEHAR